MKNICSLYNWSSNSVYIVERLEQNQCFTFTEEEKGNRSHGRLACEISTSFWPEQENSYFAALAAFRKLMCSCLYTRIGGVNPQYNFCSQTKKCKRAKLNKTEFVPSLPGCRGKGETEGSSSADVYHSRPGNGQASLQRGLTVGSLQQGASVPTSMLASHSTDLVCTVNNSSQRICLE